LRLLARRLQGEDCKASDSPKSCLACRMDECFCWETIQGHLPYESSQTRQICWNRAAPFIAPTLLLRCLLAEVATSVRTGQSSTDGRGGGTAGAARRWKGKRINSRKPAGNRTRTKERISESTYSDLLLQDRERERKDERYQELLVFLVLDRGTSQATALIL
jgi:hypothetical protein